MPLVTWINPAPITYGGALTTNQLNVTATVPGSPTYSPPGGSVLDAGTNALLVVFVPVDSVDYESVDRHGERGGFARNSDGHGEQHEPRYWPV